MDFAGRTPDQILGNKVGDNPSWHFFQARSWLDYAQRTQAPSAIHYAAFELRYGIEYLLFHLLVLANGSLTREAYKQCLGNPKAMKKMLKTHGPNYQLLAEFSKTLLSLDPRSPNLVYWEVEKLFQYWGVASEYLHFVGVQNLTYHDLNWYIKAI